MNLLEIIKNEIPTFSRVDVSPIFNPSGVTVGWECHSYLENGKAFSGGTHIDKEVAKRICIAEAIERALFFKIYSNSVQDDFLLSEYPSTCGFACGFENPRTKARAICEAVERWAWSKWIDSKYKLDEVVVREMDSLSQTLSSRFKKVRFFHKNLAVNGLALQVGVVIGETDIGVFAGSRVCSSTETPWPHAIIEAFRNFQNFEYSKKNVESLTAGDFVRRRVLYFGTHRDEALDQIRSASNLVWPDPSIRLLREFKTEINNVFLWRCLLNDWIGWHVGDDKRFVY